MRSRLVWIAIAAAASCGAPRPPEPVDPIVTAPPPVDAAPPPPQIDATPVPPPLDRDMPALAARVAALYAAAADALATAGKDGKDCAKASTELVAVRDRFKDVRDAIARVVADDRIRQLEPELDRQRDPINAALTRMQPTLDACRTDVRLNEALEGLAPGG